MDDSKGNVRDPPVNVTARPSSETRYTVPPENPESESATTDNSVLCLTCLKNHRIVYETIANYMPDTSEQSYAQFEARYPHFRKELEERYPPLCEHCAPLAREKIKQAQYLAKSDYLRRMVNVKDDRPLTWFRLLIVLGATAHYISIAGQLVWDIMGVLSDPSLASFYGLDDNTTEGSTVSSRPQNTAPLAAESSKSDPIGARIPSLFPIDKLNISTPKISKRQPELPSVDTSTDSSDDPDAMEWTPVAKPVVLSISSNQPHTPRSSVNRGAPDVNAHASSTIAKRSTSKSAFTTTGALFPNLFEPREYSPPSTPRESPTRKPKAPLAQPSFFPPKDYTSTGLEAMFDRSFKISDDVDTSSPRKQGKQQLNAKPKQRQPTDVRKYTFFCLRQASLLLAFLTFIFPSSFRWPLNIGRIIVLAVFATIPVSSIFESIKTARTAIVLAQSIAQLLVWLFFLASHIALPEDIQDHLHIEKIDMVFISIMFGWEFQFLSLFATAPQRELAMSTTGEESKPSPTKASSHDQKETWTFRDDRRANPAPAPAFISALPLEPLATPRRAATVAPASTPAPAPAPAPVPAPMFGPFNSMNSFTHSVEQGGFRTENTRPPGQLKPFGPGSVPHFPPPSTMKGSGPLRTVQEDSSSDLYPPPFSSIPRYPQPNSSFTSLSEDILERPQSPTASVTTADDTIPDPPSPQYSRYGRSTSMTPGPPLSDLSLNDSPAPSRSRYLLRNRYA
ncbi:hypothetical protein KEM56_006886 [Ascosphaera pollenicola]|nr:hypothetical protein KEM56_006886 [Ascosphaera pollenicola]